MNDKTNGILYWCTIIITIALIASAGIIPPSEELTPCETLNAKYHNIRAGDEYVISHDGFQTITSEYLRYCED
jgi:hypothetical protein